MNPAPYLKAIVAALIAGLTVLITSLDAGSLTAKDYLGASVAFLVALSTVYAVPNKP